MHGDNGGFSVDLPELESIARSITAVSDTVRTGWRGDRMDDNAWPAGEALTRSVLRYRHSLAAAAERLCARTEDFGADLGATARAYREVEEVVADDLRRVIRDD